MVVYVFFFFFGFEVKKKKNRQVSGSRVVLIQGSLPKQSDQVFTVVSVFLSRVELGEKTFY